jgi:magnesium transporter
VLAIATLVGATMPLLLHRLNIDPAVSTGPFITVSADVIGILFYFVVADLIYL